jgi:putative oxidoreductase
MNLGPKFSVMQEKMNAGATVPMQGFVAAVEFLGRLLLAQLFIMEAIGKLGEYGAAGSYMAAYGLPPQLLPLAIAVELGGGFFLLIGWQTRITALVFAGFCLTTATIFHNNFANRGEVIHFEKDLALAGAFLTLFVRGAGLFSIDAWRRRGDD